jgi:hypothetical protein
MNKCLLLLLVCPALVAGGDAEKVTVKKEVVKTVSLVKVSLATCQLPMYCDQPGCTKPAVSMYVNDEVGVYMCRCEDHKVG